MERTRVALIYVLLLLPLARPQSSSLVCIKSTNDKSGQVCAYQLNSRETDKAINDTKGELTTLRQLVEALNASNNGELTTLRQQVEALNASNNELRRAAIRTVNGWYAPLNGYQYKVTPNNQTWNESRDICQRWGGDLAMHGIQTLDTRLNLIRVLSLTSSYWIGANKENEGTWKWVNGEVATNEQIMWVPGEPNNGGNYEDCVEILLYSNHNGRSNDRSCSYQRLGLCEKPI